MQYFQAELVIAERSKLGEGPVWDAAQGALYFVNIEGRRIYRYEPETGSLQCRNTNEMVGCIVPAAGGGIIAAEWNKLVRCDAQLHPQAELMRLSTAEGIRFNDGKCDARGRLWAGVMAADQSMPGAATAGALYCLESGKPPRLIKSEMAIPNGMAWSEDQKTFYHIDTAQGCVCRYDYDIESGTITGGAPAVVIPPEDGAPDGMCIDAQGRLWIALWDGWRVVCCDPASGVRLAEISVPAKYVSCCAFGGQGMDELYITTAMDESGNGGEVYRAYPGVQGTQPFSFCL